MPSAKMPTLTQFDVKQVYDLVPMGILGTHPAYLLNDAKAISWLSKQLLDEWREQFRKAAGEGPGSTGNLKRLRFGEVNVRPHAWEFWRTILPKELDGNKVFNQLLKKKHYSAPSNLVERVKDHLRGDKPVVNGMLDTLAGINPIIKFVDRENLAIWNVTLPYHDLFPGWVRMTVREAAGGTGLHGEGRGVGNWARLNEIGSQVVFISGINDLIRDLGGSVPPNFRWEAVPPLPD